MLDLLFVFCFFLVPIVVVAFALAVKISPLQFTIPNFVILSMFAFAYLGMLPLYFGWDEYRVYMGVDDPVKVFRMFLLSAWTIFAMLLGMILARIPFGSIRPVRFSEFRGLRNSEMLLIFFWTGVCCFVLALYLTQVNTIALLSLFDGVTNVETWVARSEMSNDFSGKYHRYSAFMHDVLNLLTFILFAEYLIVRRLSRLIAFLVILSLSSFTATMTLEKGPIVWNVIGLVLVIVMVRASGKFPLRLLLRSFVVLFSLIVVLHLVFLAASDLDTAIYSVFSRAFTGGIAPAYFYLEFFPEHHPYIWGRSFPNPGGLLPFEPYMLTQEVHHWISPVDASFGVVGSAPTVYWAEIYANFSWVGVIIVPVYVGAGLYFLAILANRLSNTPLQVGFIVWLALHYQSLSQTGLSGFVVDAYLVTVLIVVFSIVILTRKSGLSGKALRVETSLQV